jgi:outer membrane protein OmpA-like peptidoglycan-associated protein
VTRRRLLLAVAALGVAACAAHGKIRENSQVVRADIDKAKRSGAARCAPKELASAEANLEFADTEVSAGHADRAQRHLSVAERNVKDALRLSSSCAPKQVIVAKKPAISIEKTDSDGDGVPDLDDACPDIPGKPEYKGCPDQDSDGDGIPDDIDRCPLDPEDKDGFQDEDGCPDPDNDGDGIVDTLDACPNEPGTLENKGCPVSDRDGDGVTDATDKCPDQPGPPPDGCPKKYTLVEVKKDKIEIKQQVHFDNAKYRVLPESFALLNQVVLVLNDYPKMRVSIEGHTDNVGGESSNLKLSQRRAEAVRDYIVAKGVSPARLQAVGYGPTKPIASNKTPKGKAKNRRTEFRIVSAE